MVVYFDEDLRCVLTKLKEEKLYANACKCYFFVSIVIFFGYEVSKDGLSRDLTKVQAVREWSTPTSLFKIHSYHDLASFYQCFI